MAKSSQFTSKKGFRFRYRYLILFIVFHLAFAQINHNLNRINSQEVNFLNLPNKSETGSIPSSSTQFYPSFGYSTNPSHGSTFQSYIPPSVKFHQSQSQPTFPQIQSYPQQSQQGYTFQQPQQSENFGFHHNHGSPERSILYPSPLPIGYYPPHFGIGTTIKPYPSTSPYPITTNFLPNSPYPYPLSTHYHSYGHLHVSELDDGFDIGTLPKQVRVPGTIRIDLNGKDAEITCEFPKYLILIQGIYWHHKYNDPFGSYYDSQNGFGNHTTVRSVNQWTSVLVIQDVNIDDTGIYRCISAAMLPADIEGFPQSPLPSPPHPPPIIPGFKTKKNYGNLNFGTPPLQTTSESPPPYTFDFGDSKKSEITSTVQIETTASSEKKPRLSTFSKNSRQMKFPSLETKGRFSRHALNPKNERYHSDDGEEYNPFKSTTNRINQNQQLSSNEIKRYYGFPFGESSYLPPPQDFKRLTNPFVNEFHTIPNIPTTSDQYHYQNQHQHQQERHYPHFHYPYPSFPIPDTTPQQYPGFELKIPYYKPSFSHFTIYQEIKFAPLGVDNRYSRSKVFPTPTPFGKY